MGYGLDAVRTVADGLDHPEAVTCTRDGVVYAGGEEGQIYRVDIDSGKIEQVGSTGGFLLGITADGDGLLYVCDVSRREVLRVDPSTGDVGVFTSGAPDRDLVNPNAGVFLDDGTMLVTDSGSWKGNDGCVMRVARDGATTVWSEASTQFPNGACLSADGRWLYIAESTTPAIARVRINDDGTAGAREEVARLSGVPDGVAVDTAGRVYVFNYRPDRIDRVTADGSIETLADDPEGTVLAAPTNGCWLEPERTRLLVASFGRWHISEIDAGATGIPLRYPSLR